MVVVRKKMRILEEPKQITENDPNGLILVPGDMDGFHIAEAEGTGKVYVYYSEVEDVIKGLQEMMI